MCIPLSTEYFGFIAYGGEKKETNRPATALIAATPFLRGNQSDGYGITKPTIIQIGLLDDQYHATEESRGRPPRQGNKIGPSRHNLNYEYGRAGGDVGQHQPEAENSGFGSIFGFKDGFPSIRPAGCLFLEHNCIFT
jgi:hypothetical protein